MLPAEIIERKRDGGELTPGEIRAFTDGYRAGEVEDYQMSAFLMAVLFRGLSRRELSALTGAIVDSGKRLDFSGGAVPAVDKHSTGGVGDKVSLVLAPLVAEAGLRVPMMSGRGLGHTGGTLDKLEAIPGFRTGLELDEFRRVLDEVGCAMIGQTDEIAPLDGRLYGLRDVTGTVPSVPLIASSIVSKKVAEGVEALVLDVKCGSGAFMREEGDALELARTLVELSGEQGLPATALVTGMEAPLGRAVGNALEVAEAVACLRGGGPGDLRRVTLALSSELLARSGGEDRDGARRRLAGILDRGRAAERFARMVEAQGGDPGIVDEPGRLPAAEVVTTFPAPRSGFLARIDARAVGLAAVELGAGRRRMGEEVDPAVGLVVERRPGQPVEDGEPLLTVHAADEATASAARRRLEEAVRVVPEPPENVATAWEAARVRWRVTPEGEERIDA
jgi:pyrimidine-nucleoside phosphorylase